MCQEAFKYLCKQLILKKVTLENGDSQQGLQFLEPPKLSSLTKTRLLLERSRIFRNQTEHGDYDPNFTGKFLLKIQMFIVIQADNI